MIKSHFFFQETYFEIPYPLPKLDMAAIPDYSSGATEHWGLITYRETNLIYDSTSSSTTNKERVAMVIAHELAHQWFGNLVIFLFFIFLFWFDGKIPFFEDIVQIHVEASWEWLFFYSLHFRWLCSGGTICGKSKTCALLWQVENVAVHR